MAKKKEGEVFVPSPYQTKIFDFVQNGQGNAVIEASAGCGKTLTLLKSIQYMAPNAKILIAAFNTDIVKELKAKIKKMGLGDRNIDCRTIHSLGYAILMRNYGGQIDRQPNDFKYSAYIYNNVRELGGNAYQNVPQSDRKNYIDNVKKLVDFGRYYLCNTTIDLAQIADKYSIGLFANEIEVAFKTLLWGKKNIGTIDFTDMVWLPNALHCQPNNFTYDWICVDEAQDLELEERNLLRLCCKDNTRMLVFGQKQQCIYAFKGGDSESFEAFKQIPNTISLPLSISYRCAKNIVKIANQFDNAMQAKEDAIDGEVKYNVPVNEIEAGDMVLCRTNAPLLQLYCELAKIGKPAIIRGKDVAKDLIKVINGTKQDMLYKDLSKLGVFSQLYNKLFDSIDKVMKRYSITFEMACEDSTIEEEYDSLQALEALADDLNTADELVTKIDNLFSDKQTAAIQLSTIHKAKGLEANNVFICCPSLMPGKSAKKEWEIEAEANLMFVAYTRAKQKLCFLSEDGFTSYSSNITQKASALTKKKNKISLLYGSDSRCGVIKPNKKAAKKIIANSTDVNIKPKNAKKLGSKPKTFNSITDFQKATKRRIRL